MTQMEALTESFEDFLLEPTLKDLFDDHSDQLSCSSDNDSGAGSTHSGPSSGSEDEDYGSDSASVTDAGPTRSRQVIQPLNSARKEERTDSSFISLFRHRKNKTKVKEQQNRRRIINVESVFEYDMSHRRRGRAIIINQKHFDEMTEMETRDGTDVDAENLLQSFGKLGFEVYRYDDLSVLEILDLLEKVAKEDHSDRDCLAVAILTHGDEDTVYGRDGPIMVDQMLGYFRGDVCPTLVGKPKLFFIQACRGHKLDDGVTLDDYDDVDGGRPQRLPVEADFLVCYATVNGYYSWRNPSRGSWFVQALCHVLKYCGEKMDMLRIMTRVSKIVAYEYESNTGTSEELIKMHKKKQIPCIVSMLTKDLYFTPKPAASVLVRSSPLSVHVQIPSRS
ncbi:caspase-7-like [Ptychodera flava]|uniref:caspase-7-like n=1 Tax=Ptychodera flava TaxID=63121 RepID=UPI003969C075